MAHFSVSHILIFSDLVSRQCTFSWLLPHARPLAAPCMVINELGVTCVLIILGFLILDNKQSLWEYDTGIKVSNKY